MWSSPPVPRHKVFISFHHAGDSGFKERFVHAFGDAFDDYSVRFGDFPENAPTEWVRQKIRDEHIRDATVTVVLIGNGTWRRRHVDWEIDSSLRHTSYNARTGLMGILLPTYQIPPVAGSTSLGVPQSAIYHSAPRRQLFWPNNIPPRLWDNVASGFAIIRPWPENSTELRQWIHDAFVRRFQDPPPVLTRVTFGNNRPEGNQFWID